MNYEMSAAQIWAAWKRQEITAGELADWQQRNKYYFTSTGEKANVR